MTESFIKICPHCQRPLEYDDHSSCLPDGAKDEKDKEEEIYDEYLEILTKATETPQSLEPQERQRLLDISYSYLQEDDKYYKAFRAFKALNHFEGIRDVANLLEFRGNKGADLIFCLVLLEDHEEIRKLLNEAEVGDFLMDAEVFRIMAKDFFSYLKNFLEKNKTPVATGSIDLGNDLIAIRNLAHEYDVAVPIARGGLKSGAVAALWGMPTKTLDIAAHKRDVPTGEWVDPVSEQDFAGKRVLLFDKDAVSGATIQQATKMLAGFHPASVAVYFNFPVVENTKKRAIGTFTDGLPPEVKVLDRKTAPMKEAGEVYIEAHEKLKTLYGQRRLMEKAYREELIPKIREIFPDLADLIQDFLSKNLALFDSLNQFLPGINEIRRSIIFRLKGIEKHLEDCIKLQIWEVDPRFKENFKGVLATTKLWADSFDDSLVRGRYGESREEAAKSRGVENFHNTSSSIAAFNAAMEASKKGFEVALIVGPEGFAYEPYFADFGIKTVAINIPESRPGQPRDMQVFEDLSVLAGKKVLVVEDDVRTGATLRRILDGLRDTQPSEVGLYLGQNENFQLMKNVPAEFKEVFVAKKDSIQEDQGKKFRDYLQTKGQRIFKTDVPDGVL